MPNRREFTKSLVAKTAALGALGVVPTMIMPGSAEAAEVAAAASASDPSLVPLYKAILQQNLLKSGETFIVATPPLDDLTFVNAMLTAAAEIGATGAHVAVIPKMSGVNPSSGVNGFHWRMYATADLLITTSMGAVAGLPGATTGYGIKAFDHPYRSDWEFLNRPGASTRWLALSGTPATQRRWFPSESLKANTLAGTQILHAGTTVRIRDAGGTDVTFQKVGRPGHAQYGIADMPGRWDNYGYGCVACAPLENQGEGVIVLQPGDIINNMPGYFIKTGPVRLTFKDGKVTNITGGQEAAFFQSHLASFRNGESFGIGHTGWGTHPRTTIGGGSAPEIGGYHHNYIGTLLFALGMNHAHGLGGPEVGYSGLGNSQRVAPNHSHFAICHEVDFEVDGRKVVEKGRLTYGPEPR